MKMYIIITMCFSFLLLTGCVETVKEGRDSHLLNSSLINTYNNMSIQNAIISQHTLYPYHFIKNGAELNELGNKDLMVLAKHFTKHPGGLNIRRDNISEDLYQARIDFVLERLREENVDVERVSISDSMPGGSDMPSEKVIVFLEGKASSKRITKY